MLALVGWLVIQNSGAPKVLPISPEIAQSPDAPRVSSGASATAAPLESNAPQFTTLLLPDQQISAIPTSVRIGLGYVPADEARTYQEWKAGGFVGAGPASFAELATIDRWIDVPATRLSDGTVRVGPLMPPLADRYDLQARGQGALHFYAVSFTVDTYPASVKPTVAAGLRIQRAPAADSDVRVLLRRGGEAQSTAVWQDLMQREAPQLLGAFNDASIAVAATQVLAPLPPGALDVILEVDGIEAERRSVTLRAGVLTDVPFDPVAQEVARAVTAELELLFVVQDTRRPIEGLKVISSGGKMEPTRTTDLAGQVRFQGVDRQRAHPFMLEFPVEKGDLPAWPTQSAIEVSLDADPKPANPSRLVRKTIELRPLQWLIVSSGSFQVPVDRRRGNPYPIFVLQQERDGDWKDSAADHFIPITQGIAASIQAPGRYRLAALQSPWSILYSTTADTRAAASDGRYPVNLIPSARRTVEISVLSQGKPLANAPLTMRGPVRGLPGATINTDPAGRARLEAVTVPGVSLEVPGFAVIDVNLDAPTVIVELRLEGDGAGGWD